jgi:hypothetical protein
MEFEITNEAYYVKTLENWEIPSHSKCNERHNIKTWIKETCNWMEASRVYL